MIINHNMNALNAHRNMTGNTAASGKSMEKLSSGLRINRAGDDAAGLAISEKMRGQIRGLDQAGRNAQDGISMLQTAEGALNETHSILQRMRELATQASNDTNTADDRGQIQQEMNQLTSEVNRIGNNTEFNTKKLLNGGDDTKAALTGHAGADLTANLSTLNAATALNIDVNGTNYEVDLSGLDGSHTQQDILDALNNATDGTSTLSKVANVSIGADNKITITAKTAGEDVTFEITEGAMGDALDIQSAFGMAQDATASGQAGTGFSADLQIGANRGQQFNITINDMRAEALGIAGGGASATNGTGTDAVTVDLVAGADNDGNPINAIDLSDATKATNAIKALDNAINTVSTERSKLGAYQNRLEHTINNLGTSSENLTAAESRVRDVDMAKEMMTFSKNNILSQAAQAMISQANQQPQGVLQLLR